MAAVPPWKPRTQRDDEEEEEDGMQGEERADASSAHYPVPGPLSEVLQAVMRKKELRCEVESAERALEEIVRNCLVAVDAMYFATPARQRRLPEFQHRLCLRVTADPANNALSITDLGIGMTRADIINTLGVGHLSDSASLAADTLANTPPADDTHQKQDDDVSTDDDDDTCGRDCQTDGDDNQNRGAIDTPHKLPEQAPSTSNGCPPQRISPAAPTDRVLIPCKAGDIGGFYASLCALGVGINVGTKSKFDDYYEYQLGKLPQSKDSTIENFTHFSVSRPMSEGVKPSVSNGYSSFSDVRGDSGTRVTIILNECALAAGLLQYDVLKRIITKILETSHYTVEFWTNGTEVARIIDASRIEEEAKQRLAEIDGNEEGVDFDDENDVEPMPKTGSHHSVKERAKFIPLRLTLGERKMLRLVEAAMTCCAYTSEIDKPFKSSVRRTHTQLKCITSVLRGLVTACDYGAGQKLLASNNYSDYEEFFRKMFEIARRHKIMNPEKMRTEYGKLIYLLQDAVSPSVLPLLSFSCKGPIVTVYNFLKERKGLALLEDKFIEVATQEILPEKKSRAQIATEIKRKEKAVAILKQHYRSSLLTSDDIHVCLYSIGDNESFINFNRIPIDKVIGYLQDFFAPGKIEDGYSLSIVSGMNGSRLSHSHDRQYYFALQSLTLWRDIIDDMYRLWAMAEDDLLSESVAYALKDTGQGMQRVQQSPRTYKSMQQILSRVQGKVAHWVGSSVIHLGDHNVPNALSFIDKYTQVPRILGPIVSCLENLERLCEEDEGIDNFIETGFGGLDRLTKDILYDFFKSAFDGSGADNFYDAGSCIDGRLTSAWNWCSQLPNKPFYCIFKLTGFTGFDGEFK